MRAEGECKFFEGGGQSVAATQCLKGAGLTTTLVVQSGTRGEEALTVPSQPALLFHLRVLPGTPP